MKTVLFQSQVTSHRSFGKGSVAMEVAGPWSRRLPRCGVIPPLGRCPGGAARAGWWLVWINDTGSAAKENNSEAVTLGKAFASSRSFQTSALGYQRQLLK